MISTDSTTPYCKMTVLLNIIKHLYFPWLGGNVNYHNVHLQSTVSERGIDINDTYVEEKQENMETGQQLSEDLLFIY